MYSFFGIPTTLELKKSDYKSILQDELSPYKIDKKEATILITDDWLSFDSEIISNNPSQHYYYKNSIHIKDKLTELAFVFDAENKLTTIFFKLNYASSFTRRSIRKCLNMQFTNRIENIGQIFHENVLIPMTFFFEHLTPIHASGYSLNAKTVLLGGTGGTGKTTLEMEMCLQHHASFVTDDIAIVDNEGFVYPNYNNPKIYAYNLIGKPKLKKIIFKGKSIFNKLHWTLHKTVFGVSKARRKINPFVLYENVINDKEKLHTYHVLSKNNTANIKKQKIEIKQAIQMSNSVIATEYNYFFNHLKWHEFNAVANANMPIISIKILEKRWEINLAKVLQNTENTVVTIPFNIPHIDFKKQAIALLLNTIS